MTQKTNQKGFTLIELLITIAIVAILVTLALPAYNSYKDRAVYMEVVHSVETAKTAVDICAQINGALCTIDSGGAAYTGTAAAPHSSGAVIAGAAGGAAGGPWTITSTPATPVAGSKWNTAPTAAEDFVVVGTLQGDNTVHWVVDNANSGCISAGYC